MHIRIASTSFHNRVIPNDDGVSIHLTSARIKNLLSSTDCQSASSIFTREDSVSGTQQPESHTPEAIALAHLIEGAIGRRKDDEQRLCRFSPSERPGYDVCVTFWPEDEPMYNRVYRSLVSYIKPPDVSAGAIAYEVL